MIAMIVTTVIITRTNQLDDFSVLFVHTFVTTKKLLSIKSWNKNADD